MSCPLYIDYTRECIKEISFIPTNTINYCTTDKFVKCPFYRIINKEKNVCKNISGCYAFKHFQMDAFDKFVALTEEYCTSPNHKNCQRYIVKERTGASPKDLHPDGGKMD